MKLSKDDPKEFDRCKALYHAASECKPDIARAILDTGLTPNCSSAPTDPLFAAAKYGCRSVAETLLSKGGNINFRASGRGMTPLDAALSGGQLDMAAFLAQRGSRRTLSDEELDKWYAITEEDAAERRKMGLAPNRRYQEENRRAPRLAKADGTQQQRSASQGPQSQTMQQAGSGRASGNTALGNCPTSISHIAPSLPVCNGSPKLLEMRRLALATDVSFREDVAKGYSLKTVAVTAANATQQFEAAMKQNEEAMEAVSASSGGVRARISALKATPPRCDADERSQGMLESAYQAYATVYIASLVNRAVAAIAACRARAEQ